MFYELPADVLGAPLNLALVLQVRRKRKMSVNAEKLNRLLHAQGVSCQARLFEQKFYGLFEHMSLAFESTSL
jgi:hypothetical protein